MKLLLTSAGVKNASIERALVGLLGKPIAQCHALAIPTALYGHPMGSPQGCWRFITGNATTPMTELGWKSQGVLELTALPSVPRERWEAWVRAADVFLVNGGDAQYLAHWMRQSGFVELMPSLRDKVWCGLSAGSMVMAPRVGEDFIEHMPSIAREDRALGVVGFSIFPHLDHPDLPDNTMAAAERWAAGLGNPSYAIDDQTAIQVVDGAVEVVSEGTWRYFKA
jgi:dipeptidase E